MDDPDSIYDPDCDVSRYLNFTDPDAEELPLPPLPPLDQPVNDGSAMLSLPLAESGVKAEPLGVEGVIISAMEGVHIEGSSSSATRPVYDTAYEPIFEHYQPGQRDCTHCVTLREVSHSCANRNLIFAIHGGLGTFDHAVFDVEHFQEDGLLLKHELFYVDLSTRSHDWVSIFMVGCVTLLETDATGTTRDSMSSFYNTLCADLRTRMQEILGFDFGCVDDPYHYLVQLPPNFEVGESSRTKGDVLNNRSLKIDVPVAKEPTVMIPNPPIGSATGSAMELAASPVVTNTDYAAFSDSSSDSPPFTEDVTVEPADAGRRVPARTPLALQRQRTANMRLPELANYLHLPMAEAARRLKVCSTALKHVCRRNGLARWPSRQIQAIDRQIEKLERDMIRGNKRGGLFAIKEEIDALQIKKAGIYEKMLTDN